jgi:hypothetical protein
MCSHICPLSSEAVIYGSEVTPEDFVFKLSVYFEDDVGERG